jgi:ribonuclease E
MTKRMLIDATHAEETRVVVLDGNRLEDFDVETSGKKQLKGNIYLAKVVRVEPSLQAAFVEYGGNRHGFLAFGEIHPDYYQIPVADRQRLIALQAEAARAEQAAEEALDVEQGSGVGGQGPESKDDVGPAQAASLEDVDPSAAQLELPVDLVEHDLPPWESAGATAEEVLAEELRAEIASDPIADETPSENHEAEQREVEAGDPAPQGESRIETVAPEAPPQTVGGEQDSGDDTRERRIPMQFLRNYKIQEVIRRRQILLVQVVKEERGTKGAALTTYISLAGRFSVLMPNSPRGGGISRKITSAADRRRLKEITAELEIPDGMGMIVRTAGANRPKPEIKRDCEYLLRLWDEVRETTLRSVAPALIHEEASLIKRAIRDVYSRDIEEILVDGEEGWRAARDFMRMLMPAHAQKVIAWRDPTQPLFGKHGVEAQLDAMMGKTVQLRSGGYLVIDQTEALVSIDVNSGRSTRERGIEETALRTNLEAADEVARQLRLRDLAGLVVIDFIDMEAKKHNAMVERRMAEALKADRARIQVGHISHFGLLEMSRQRLRPSLMEASLVACPHCSGTGHVRSTESAAIHVLRGIEDEGARRRNAEIMVHVAGAIAMFILNHKRERLRMIEQRYGLRVLFTPDATLLSPQMRIEKLRSLEPSELPAPYGQQEAPLNAAVAEPAEIEEVDLPDLPDIETEPAEPLSANPESAESRAEEENRRRRRRRRRGPRREDAADGLSPVAALGAEQPDLSVPPPMAAPMPVAQPDAVFVPPPVMPPPVMPPPVIPTEVIAVETAPALVSEPPLQMLTTDEPVPEMASVELPADLAVSPALTQPEPAAAAEEEGEPKARRRGRRGGRRRKRDEGEEAPVDAAEPEPTAAEPARYDGPTPADPFGRQPLDIFDVMEQFEQAQHAPPPAVAPAPPEAESPPVSNGLHLVETQAEPPAQFPALEQPAPEPLVKPVLINAPAADRKRGWWRR